MENGLSTSVSELIGTWQKMFWLMWVVYTRSVLSLPKVAATEKDIGTLSLVSRPFST